MNGFFKLGLQASPNHLKQASKMLSFLFCFLLFSKLWAQEVQFFECTESTPTFTGVPEPTLCEEYPNFSCEIQIGSGTQYPKSSLLGASILSGNICIIGNFEVDAAFTFQNAIVKINPGVTISLKPSSNWNDVGGTLSIDNSKLFACNGMWNGIKVGFLSSLITSNNSEIEDAQTAISATGLCELIIQQTTFNRNLVGVVLNTPFPNIFVPGPQVWAFSDNLFKCDAPLNGTIDGISYSGMEINNSYLYTSPTGNNSFQDLRFGIICNGQSSYLGVKNLVFNRIRSQGIRMSHGYLSLKKSSFSNSQIGIYIETAHNVSISDDCRFKWDDSVLPQVPDPNKWYRGIEIGGFGMASKTSITNNSFDVDFSSIDRRSSEIYISGIVGGGSKISINGNRFHSYGETNHGIVISTNFPSKSETNIVGNFFDIKNISPIDDPWSELVPSGVIILGNQNNFNVFDNTFFNSAPIDNYHAFGMYLSGSEGENNHISNNHFNDLGSYLGSYVYGIVVAQSKNTTFCANDFYNSLSAFSFAGQNDGTVLSGNIVYGGQLVNLGSLGTWIDDQDQEGNQWTTEYNGSQLPFWTTLQAFCRPEDVQYSQFFVHTKQSTAYNGVGFNPFHPKDINPDTDDEWWKQKEGTPSDCIDWLLGAKLPEDSRLKREIVNGSFAEKRNDPAERWQAERSVYFSLKRNPSLEANNPDYSAFRSAKEFGNIGKLYEVATAKDAVMNGSSMLITDAENNQIAIENLIGQIESAELGWQNATNSTDREIAKNTKKQKMTDLMVLMQTAADLQAVYKQNLIAAIPSIEQINNSIPPQNALEIYEKTVNTIHLKYLLTGSITDGQLQELLPIASLCPKIGGMAVFQARTLIPPCLGYRFNDMNNDCYAALTAPTITGSRSAEFEILESDATKVMPNPATDIIMVLTPFGQQGKIKLFNTMGNLVLEKPFFSSKSVLETDGMATGIYNICIEFNSGKRENHKIFIHK